MRQGDSDQHIPCLVAKEINCGPRRSRIPQAFREGGSKKGESVLGFKRKVDTQYEGLKTNRFLLVSDSSSGIPLAEQARAFGSLVKFFPVPLFNTDTLCYVSAYHSVLPDWRVKGGNTTSHLPSPPYTRLILPRKSIMGPSNEGYSGKTGGQPGRAVKSTLISQQK